jgi:catechol 2,3-dioxygenase-like lactoylglutathione lyase family enzyme
MPTGIDHIVIAVRDLAQTTSDYQRAGFTVVQGGEHKGGATHNALVAFNDGVYFELIAFKNPDAEQDHKWWTRLATGEGLIDYALRTNDLAQEAVDLRARGLDASDPIDGGRFRPDGERLDWQTLRFEGASSSALPFYCFDLTERNLRVPHGDDAVHANGAEGVAGLTVVVADINASSPQFEALTGTAGEIATEGYEGATEARRFALGNAWITIVQPTEQPSDLRQHLSVRGDSIYSVSLIAPAGGEASIPIELVHGARLLLPAGSQSSDIQSSESVASRV